MTVLSFGYNTKTFVERIEQNDQTIHKHNEQTDATAYSTGIRLSMLTSTTRTVGGLLMKTMKRNRLRQLVSWGYITQSEANQLWREYLRFFKRVNQG